MSEAQNRISDDDLEVVTEPLSVEPERRRPGRPRKDGTAPGSPRGGEPVNLFGSAQGARKPAAKKNIEPIKNMLVSMHVRLALLTGVPELIIDDAEATMLAENGAALMDYYKIKIDGKRGAMLAFIYAVTIVYGPRVFAYVIAQRMKTPQNAEPATPSD
jgi:hypothetical protein